MTGGGITKHGIGVSAGARRDRQPGERRDAVRRTIPS